MITKAYADFSWQQAEQLLSIDSPSGYTDYAALWLKSSFEMLGFSASITTKGGILVDLGGENPEDALMLAAHTDTLGAMVAEIKGNGRLRLTPLGGMNANNAEAENVRIYTRGGKVLEGTFQLCNASIHVNGDYNSAKRGYDNMEVVLDESAKIDGCSYYGTYFRIILPLIVPALVTSAIFSFIWRWDDYLSALLYVNRANMRPVSLALQLFSDPSSGSDIGSTLAMSTLSIIPATIIFLIFQKSLVEGIATTGIKG